MSHSNPGHFFFAEASLQQAAVCALKTTVRELVFLRCFLCHCGIAVSVLLLYVTGYLFCGTAIIMMKSFSRLLWAS